MTYHEYLGPGGRWPCEMIHTGGQFLGPKYAGGFAGLVDFEFPQADGLGAVPAERSGGQNRLSPKLEDLIGQEGIHSRAAWTDAVRFPLSDRSMMRCGLSILRHTSTHPQCIAPLSTGQKADCFL